MTIKSLYFLVQESEGFSVRGNDLLTYAAKEGYAVGGAEPEVGVFKCMNDDLSFRVFNREMNRLQSVVTDPNQVIGAWVDDPKGVVYLELSDVVKSKKIAMELAKARGEKAIYDFAKSESIYL